MSLTGEYPVYDPHDEPFELHWLMPCDLAHNDLCCSGLDSSSQLVTAIFTQMDGQIMHE
jgi:hypothetical protein